MIFASCKNFNSGDARDGKNGRAPRGAGEHSKEEESRCCSLPAALGLCCCSLMRSLKYLDTEFGLSPRNPRPPNRQEVVLKRSTSPFP